MGVLNGIVRFFRQTMIFWECMLVLFIVLAVITIGFLQPIAVGVAISVFMFTKTFNQSGDVNKPTVVESEDSADVIISSNKSRVTFTKEPLKTVTLAPTQGRPTFMRIGQQ